MMTLEFVRNRWAQVLSAVLGLWLMAAPDLLGYGTSASTVHHAIGPMVAAFSIVALWEHMRSLRWMNLPLGGVLAVISIVVGGATVALANGVVVGLALVGLGFIRGRVTGRYGGSWSSLWTGDIIQDSVDDERG